MGAMACQEVDNKMDITAMGGDGITINVSSLAPQTKIEFTDNDTSGIVLEWEVGDAFTVYDSEGEIVGDFVCSSQNEDETYAFMLSLLDGKSFDSGDYTAIYPASEELTLEAAQARDLTSTQNGDDISKLNDA